MKKTLKTALFLSLCVLLTGCGGNDVLDNLPEGKNGYEKICSQTSNEDGSKITTYVGVKESTSSVTTDFLFVVEGDEVASLSGSKKDEWISSTKETMEQANYEKVKVEVKDNKGYISYHFFTMAYSSTKDVVKELEDSGMTCK